MVSRSGSLPRGCHAPLKTGTPVAEAVKAWGQPAAKFDLQTMHVGNGQVIGFAFGEWPDADGQRWNPVDQINARYPAPVPNASVSVEECQAAMAHIYDLMGSKESVDQVDIDDCRATSSSDRVKCMLAAKNTVEVADCESTR